MDSFEELGLAPELVEALAAEGIERPTPLQEAAVPVLRRGNNLVLAAGPGGGTLVAWGAAVLDRVDAEGDTPRVLALTPSAEVARSLALSLARLAAVTGHTVAALGSPWVLPGRAHILFGAPADVLAAAHGGGVRLENVSVLVVDQAEKLESLQGLAALEEVLGFLPKEGQRIVTALPVTPGVADFVERHVRRAATVPSHPSPGAGAAPPRRGTLAFRVVPEPREEGVLRTVAELLDEGARHVLVYCRSDDRAADVGDFLTLHGFIAGAPGDEALPVWLGVEALSARAAASAADDVRVVSCDPPSGPDDLDRRHSLSEGGVAVVLPREIPHLRDVARRTGYKLEPLPLRPSAVGGDIGDLRDALLHALEEEDVDAYTLVLEPLFETHDPVRVAAAATALLRKKGIPGASERPDKSPPQAKAPAWVKVFLSVGSTDELTPGDLLGAITGEAGVLGEQVGRIDIKDRHSLVEIEESVAQKVIRALNGTTIRGRSVRADVDRGRRRPPSGRGGPPRGRPPRRP